MGKASSATFNFSYQQCGAQDIENQYLLIGSNHLKTFKGVTSDLRMFKKSPQSYQELWHGYGG